MATFKLQAVATDNKPQQAAAADNPALQSHERVIIELIAASLEQKSFLAVSNALVNELAGHLKCDRVSLMLSKAGRGSPQAISNSVGINSDSKVIERITAVMDEALDQKTTITFPASQQDTLLITTAHEQLARAESNKSICTVLLSHNHEIIGALSLERPVDKPFDEQSIFFCQRLALLVGPLLLLKYEEENWLIERCLGAIKNRWRRLVTRGQYTEKTLYAIAVLILLVLGFASGTYRVKGDAILEGKVQRMITSPIDGFIAEVHVRAGDIVKGGQVMAGLDDRELKLEKLKLQGEYDSYQREYRDARAKYDLTQVGILSAKMSQARAQLEIIDEQLKRLLMTAPFDGVVVEGGLEQALGSPVERGQVLLKIAPLNDYRIILKIDDRDIAQVNAQQTGKLTLASLPGEVMHFAIKNITPVSIAEDGRNYFKVEAQLEQKNKLLRPGMHGVAKIEVGDRKLAWIWFHRFTDWLRYQLWSL